MRNRTDVDLREQAERALRAGRAREALGFYRLLLDNAKAEGADYDAWLDGAAAAYLALGRTREAGYALLGLRRYAEAQRHFPAAECPLDWALCAARLGQHGEAARVLSEHGHPALAAIELDAAGARAGARTEWERALRDPRLSGRPYETALVHFKLGECLLALGDKPAALRAFAAAERLLEPLADEFETRGELDSAFECYGLLLRMGKDGGSFENVAEGYLNSIRIAIAEEKRSYVIQYYDDFLAYAVEREEWHAAATIAREIAEYSLRQGLPYDRHYLARAAELWERCAREQQAAEGPVELVANAFHAAIDAAISIGDFALSGRLYAALAELPLPDKPHARYAALARRYETMPIEARLPAPAVPDYLRRPNAYEDVWRQDLIEWELGGDPASVLARFVAEVRLYQHTRFAVRALLLCASPTFDAESRTSAAELAVALGLVQRYEVLAPLECLYQHPAPEVRAAVMRGASKVFAQRTFKLIRWGLADAAREVVDEALRALAENRFADALAAWTRIFRESGDERVRLVVLRNIGWIGSPAAALMLLEVARQDTGSVRAAAAAELAGMSGDDVVALVRQARDAEIGDRREVLERIVRKMG